ncbi:MAG: hypothetical protein HY952_07180 [Elusimicrobia bacterium]|nr:hypothetical protein [Elusimicrobiota bacterium]
MLPIFKAGGTTLLSPSRPLPGDCAVYSYEGRLLLHRVLRTDSGGAWLADDAGRIEEHFVPWDDVRGRALGGPLSSGLPGLVYSRVRRAVFRFFVND